MNDLEARLRNSLRYNLDPIDAAPRLPDDVASKARTRRFIMMVGVGMTVVVLAASTVWMASIQSSDPSQLPAAPAPSESPQEAWTTHTNESGGFSIATPEGWSVRWAALDQSPALYVSTFDFDLSHGFCGADGPLTILPSDGAFFWLYEIPGLSAPQRSTRFDLDESSLASYEGSGCVPTYRIDFSDSGRDFSIHTAFGDQAGQNLRQQVLDSLNSLKVFERASETSPTPPDCPPVGEGGYRIELSESSGPPGSTVEVSGPTPIYAEDGSYRPPDGEIQLWLNADPEAWHSVLPGGDEPVPDKPGEVRLLGTAQLAGTCAFSTTFTVPDFPAGSYLIVPVNFGGEDKDRFSATFFGAHAPTFEVVD